MIIVEYKNIDLEALFTRGKSVIFKEIVDKKMFIQAIYGFKSILRVIDNVAELKLYQYLHYRKYSTYSTVTIEGSGLTGCLMFSETEQGNSITLYELIVNNKGYVKKRNF